jgi:hypothetical protein
MKHFSTIAILSAYLVLMSGCIIVSDTKSDPAKSALPKESQKVGGGFEIAYLMPEDGTVVLIDKTTGKTIQTISLKEGETFDFLCRATDQKMFKDMGVDIQRADFVLYSYPKRQRSAQASAQSAMLMPPPPLSTLQPVRP